jgi:hypothetical protein
MFSNNKKLEYYGLLNGIRMDYLKTKEPFDINILRNESNVKLTYNDIQLRYLKDKNYFVVVKKPQFNTQGDRSRNDKPPSQIFTPEETAEYLERKKRREQRGDHSPGERKTFTPEETAEYLERKKRREQRGENNPDRSRSSSPRGDHSTGERKTFTPEETAEYLERKKRREQRGEKKNGGSRGTIKVYC